MQVAQQASAATPAAAAQRIRSNVKDLPHVPFVDPYYSETSQGVWGKFTLKDKYTDPGTDGILMDLSIVGGSEAAKAGGYDVREVWERAVRTSIEGLGSDFSEMSLGVKVEREQNEKAKDIEMSAVE